MRTAGLEETLNVYRNYHSDHSPWIALLGGFSGIGGGPFYGTGYYGGGGLGLIVVILLILLLLEGLIFGRVSVGHRLGCAFARPHWLCPPYFFFPSSFLHRGLYRRRRVLITLPRFGPWPASAGTVRTV